MVGGAAAVASKHGKKKAQKEAAEAQAQQQLADEAAQQAPPQPPPTQPTPGAMSDDAISQLEGLGKLRDDGVLTEEEFAAKKAQILGL